MSALLAVLLLPPHIAQAQTARGAEPYNSVELQAEANREISNDTLNATLYAEASDADAARVADALNRASNDALKAAAGFKAVRARSGGSNTYPVYDRNQRLTGWRGRAEIRLESRDFQAASALIAKLQEGMQLSSLSFKVSREFRTSTENELIAEAVKAFRGRADIARQALGGKSYRLRRIAINTSGSSPPPRPMLRMSAAAAPAEVAAPQLEGGLSTVTVSVSGTIEVE
jgi:predicted secreted protein